MQCSKCNSQVPDIAKFCPRCGEPVAPKNDPPVPLKPIEKPKLSKADKVKKVLMWVALTALVAFFVVLFVIVNNENQTKMQEQKAKQEVLDALDSKYNTYYSNFEIERRSENEFFAKCELEKSGELYSYSGEVSCKLYDNGADGWDISSFREKITYNFAENDNFYYVGLRGGNYGYLFKFTSINESVAKLKIHTYSMGHYGGPDSFGQETETVYLSYDEENQCFTFHWISDWRLYPDRLERDVAEKSRVEFEESRPVDPNNYWWYKRTGKS